MSLYFYCSIFLQSMDVILLKYVQVISLRDSFSRLLDIGFFGGSNDYFSRQMFDTPQSWDSPSYLAHIQYLF